MRNRRTLLPIVTAVVAVVALLFGIMALVRSNTPHSSSFNTSIEMPIEIPVEVFDLQAARRSIEEISAGFLYDGYAEYGEHVTRDGLYVTWYNYQQDTAAVVHYNTSPGVSQGVVEWQFTDVALEGATDLVTLRCRSFTNGLDGSYMDELRHLQGRSHEFNVLTGRCASG